jgi:hypothetical protein
MSNWRGFQHEPPAKLPRNMNIKEERKDEKNKIKVPVEEWKKNWK